MFQPLHGHPHAEEEEPRSPKFSASFELHESSRLGKAQLQVRFLFLAVGMLLIGEAMVHPLLTSGGHESVERRFLRSSNAMMRKRVPPRKGPLELEMGAGGLATRLGGWGGAGTAANGSDCQRLLWFTCLGQDPTRQQQRQLQAALLSARRHSPSLLPVLVHSGEPAAEAARWFAEHGGHVVQHQLSFLPEFEQLKGDKDLRKNLLKRQAGFLRLDTPLVLDRIIQEGALELSNVSTTYALFTDSDVLFLGPGGGGDGSSKGSGGGGGLEGGLEGEDAGWGDLSTCNVPAPQFLMLGREHAKGAPWDTGVLLLNIPALRAALPEVLRFAAAAGWDFPGYEQGLINGYLREHTPALEVLPDALSWKAYWGPSHDALLLHWLGPKPAHAECMRCYLANRARGPNWAQLGGCACTRVAFKKVFQRAPDHGKMYATALGLFEGYLQSASSLGDGAAAAE